MDNMNNGALSWDSAIENDGGSDFILLPEGDYVFQVQEMTRGRFNGSEKTPACEKATLTLLIKTDTGLATVFDDLILHRNMEWRIAAFFRAIGQKKRGEKLIPRWNEITGEMGRCHIKVDTYTGRDGRERQKNKVDKYYDWDASKMPMANFTEATVEDDIPF